MIHHHLIWLLASFPLLVSADPPFATADTSSGRLTNCIVPHWIGYLIPSISVILVCNIKLLPFLMIDVKAERPSH